MKLSPSEKDMLYNMSDIYIEVKSVIILCEELDPDSKSNLQIIKELRDAFDHIMRVFYNLGHEYKKDIPDYNNLNIEKALGHVYRAAYDALDGCGLSIKENIVELLSPYPTEILTEILDDYWENKKKIVKISEKIGTHREKKDVGDFNKEALGKYTTDVNELKLIYENILDHQEHFTEYYNELKRTKIWKIILYVIVPIITAIGGVFLGCYLTNR